MLKKTKNGVIYDKHPGIDLVADFIKQLLMVILKKHPLFYMTMLDGMMEIPMIEKLVVKEQF